MELIENSKTIITNTFSTLVKINKKLENENQIAAGSKE